MSQDTSERRYDGGDASRMESLNREIARMTAQWRQDVEDSVELYNLLTRARSWINMICGNNSGLNVGQRVTVGQLLEDIDVALREIPRR
jgi:hypothetical protein